jgi:hypothetical protein
VKTKPLDNLFSTDLGATGDNFAVGGENRWALSSVVRALHTAKREDDRTR